MKVKIQSIHFDADVKLIRFIEERIGKLTTYSNQIISGEVYLRLDKSTTTENKIVEVKLLVPGSDLFAKRQCRTFEEAADQAAEALRTQLQRRKERVA